jgi:hypothetical protein
MKGPKGMARPKLGDGESERLQMVITREELKAIEDWRYSRRVPSKSEAIRRLVQIGLRMSRNVGPVLLHIVSVEGSILKARDEMADAVSKCTSGTPPADITNILSNALLRLEGILREQITARDNIIAMLAMEVDPLMRADVEFNNALERAERHRALLIERASQFTDASGGEGR